MDENPYESPQTKPNPGTGCLGISFRVLVIAAILVSIPIALLIALAVVCAVSVS